MEGYGSPVEPEHYYKTATIAVSDMPVKQQEYAVDCALLARELHTSETDIAAYIKIEFDKKYEPTWHVVVGKNYGSYVTHQANNFVFFYLRKVAFLVFKSATHNS